MNVAERAVGAGRLPDLAAIELADAAIRAAPASGSIYSGRDRVIRRLLVASDVVGLCASLVVLGSISRTPSLARVMAYGLPTIPIWLSIFAMYGMYRRDHTRISHTTFDDIPWLFHSMLVGCPLFWFYFRFLPGEARFGKVLAFGGVAALVILILRWTVRGVSGRALAPERTLLVGDGTEIAVLSRSLRAHSSYGVQPVARVCGAVAETLDAGVPLVGQLADIDLRKLVGEHRIDRVIVADHALDQMLLMQLLRDCRDLSLKATVLPALTDVMGPSVQLDDVAGMTLITINPLVLSPGSRAAKRVLDFFGASGLLILSLPVLVLIAVATKLDSDGPILFRQERVGRGGRPFKMIKFRSMVPDAELLRSELLADSRDPSWLDLEHDPRVTRLGRVLRHSSLDELPQLWNVCRGQMSLVGPRPLIPAENANLIGWTRDRLDLTPGITGLWQVLGRTNIPFEEMLKLDYLYVTNWSLWGDVRLLVKTLPAVFLRRGAN